MNILKIVLLVIFATWIIYVNGATPAEEDKARKYIQDLDQKLAKQNNRLAIVSWNYDTNMNEDNLQKGLKESAAVAAEQKRSWTETIKYNWTEYKDSNLKRMFKFFSVIGHAALPPDKNTKLTECIAKMGNNFATATVCSYKDKKKCNLGLSEISQIFQNSRDPKELQNIWEQWHHNAGTVSKGNFTIYVQLKNEAARLNKFANVAEWWLNAYESSGFEQQMLRIWNQVKPVYEQIHAYVRFKLRKIYGPAVVSATGPIPAHLLGDLWAQQWTGVYPFTRPFPDHPVLDVTGTMKKQNYTVKKMFQMADQFFVSLNLSAVPDNFWSRSIFERPKDGRDFDCQPTAIDFFDRKDFRIRGCLTVTENFLETSHHEMGHIQYFMQYKNQPAIYRDGTNPGFHEAVGDLIALSVGSRTHLKKIGLIPVNDPEDDGAQINQLYRVALVKIVLISFALLLDTYRYAIFRGNTKPEDYNCHFWNLREKLNGVQPPVVRTEKDFDAAAKYHISSDVEYARYFVSFVVQFQFHEAVCGLAGQFDKKNPKSKLSSCDIFKSVKAGNTLGKMLSMGASRPWPDAMQLLTGQRDMSSSGLFQYFQPLYDWLKKENTKNGAHVGWTPSTVRYCTDQQRAKLPKIP